MKSYAEIIVPLPLETTFTYEVPEELNSEIAVGQRVIVPFGSKKYYTGIVRSVNVKPPTDFEVKQIGAILDKAPVVRHPQMKFWEWMADYYMCAVGDVYKAAVPSGLKVESETFVEINPDYEDESGDADKPKDDLESEILQLLDHEGNLTVDVIARKLDGRRGVTAKISRMLESGKLIISEKIVERYRPIRERCVRPTFSVDLIADAFKRVKGASKQEKLLLALIELSGLNRPGEPLKEVTRAALLDRSGTTSPILSAVVAKGLAENYTRETNRFKFDGKASGVLPQLSDEQKRAMHEITDLWHDKSTVLLHGVTSSGKTEIYAHLIDATLRRGMQVLYLVPEIALTTQLTRRLQKIFGNNIVVYHSKFSDNERVDIWKTMLKENKPLVILGARSALFLPFSKIGLVIVDEEHEPSYKQSDPAPRYNGRDAALMLAWMHGAKSLLGTATPSIETYNKALEGKFGLVTLSKRYNDHPLPPIRIVDMSVERQKKNVTGTFSIDLVKAVNTATQAGKQALIFRNRRGFAPIARCKQCAWIPKCKDCDVSLTYHNYSRQLVCHYCGAVYPMPNLCPQCQQPAVEVIGYGTERIEGDVEALFPARKVIRMDLDTTRNKDSYASLIEQFSEHKADILVGTQMVTKGLDFKDVQVVAVLNADELINIPDFKASERAFNMLEQVSGRAGRADSAGAEVIIQTYKPDHQILKYLMNHDYRGYYDYEIAEREKFGYPPFTHIIYIYLKHRDQGKLEQFSNAYASHLRQLLGNRVAGPDKPKVARVKSLYIQKIMIKVERTASLSKVRDILREAYRTMAADPTMKTAMVYYDVDP